jgi:hypothetical protein
MHRSRRILSGTLLTRALIILAHIAAAPALRRLRLTVMPVICGGAVRHRNLRDVATDRRELAEAGSFTLKMLPMATALISGGRLRRLRNEGRRQRCIRQCGALKFDWLVGKGRVLGLNVPHSFHKVEDSQVLLGRQRRRAKLKAQDHVSNRGSVVCRRREPLHRLMEAELYDRVVVDVLTQDTPRHVIDERTRDLVETCTVRRLSRADSGRYDRAHCQECMDLSVSAFLGAITEPLGNDAERTEAGRHAIDLALQTGSQDR